MMDARYGFVKNVIKEYNRADVELSSKSNVLITNLSNKTGRELHIDDKVLIVAPISDWSDCYIDKIMDY